MVIIMKKNILKRIFIILLGMLPIFAACNVHFEQFGEFSVRYLDDGCKEIRDGKGRKLMLVPGGYEVPKEKKVNIIRIPIKRAVVFSGNDAAAIKAIGQINTIIGVAKKEGWTIPEIKDGIENGRVAYLGEYTSIDYEKLKTLKPDVVFTWNDAFIPKLKELSIPCVFTSTKIAKDLNAHIKFIQFMSAFYGEEERAKTFVKKQFEKIAGISAKVNMAKQVPKVVWGDIYERKVLVEPGNSWAAQVVEKAGGNYLFSDLEGGG